MNSNIRAALIIAAVLFGITAGSVVALACEVPEPEAVEVIDAVTVTAPAAAAVVAAPAFTG